MMPIDISLTDLTDLLITVSEPTDVVTRPGEAAEVTTIATTISEV